MSDDEQAIRDLIETWMSASRAGDVATVLGLMTDDVVFMVPGREPFGKQAFASASAGMKGVAIDGAADVREVQVVGDWAYCRAHLRVAMTLPDGRTDRRAGHTLTILRKGPDGAWAIARDANMLAPA
jgi:uncharacterized protein (TIGR02246 family)